MRPEPQKLNIYLWEKEKYLALEDVLNLLREIRDYEHKRMKLVLDHLELMRRQSKFPSRDLDILASLLE